MRSKHLPSEPQGKIVQRIYPFPKLPNTWVSPCLAILDHGVISSSSPKLFTSHTHCHGTTLVRYRLCGIYRLLLLDIWCFFFKLKPSLIKPNASLKKPFGCQRAPIQIGFTEIDPARGLAANIQAFLLTR